MTEIRTVLLKLSGEAFAPASFSELDDNNRLPISPGRVDQFGREIATALHHGPLRLAIVVGGGNIWRGGSGAASRMDRNEADMMGMLATIINALALRDALSRHGATEPRVMSRVPVHAACEDWIHNRAIKHLDRGRIVICAAGLGEPNFTTDTAAVQRGVEIGADVVLKGTHGTVDGIYDDDPRTNPEAAFIEDITFDEVIGRGLQVMDSTAFTHARQAKLSIRVFNSMKEGNITRALWDEDIGTLVHA